jgi:glutathione S-transferase
MDPAPKREPPPASQSAYGDYDAMLETLTGPLFKGPYLPGDTMTAAYPR